MSIPFFKKTKFNIDIKIILWYDNTSDLWLWYIICTNSQLIPRRLISATAECCEPDSSSTSHFERPRIQQNFIRRLISATAECCEPDSSSTSHFERPRIQQNFIRRLIEVVTTGEQAKIIDCCFCEVMETKQGVSGESNTCARDDYATRRARVLKICRSSGR